MRRSLGVLLAAFVAAVVGLQPVPAAADPAPPAAFASYGQGDVDVRGMYGTASYFFPIPPGTRVVGPVAVNLDFSHSELLVPDRSTLTLRVNDVSLASTFLTPANQRHGQLSAAVPAEIVGDDGLFVEARFFMRLTRDDCEEPTNPALWATVHSTSIVALPTDFAGPRDVADIPDLVVPATAKAAPLTLVVPDDPSPVLLEAAGVAAATAGNWLGAAGRDAVVATASTAPADAPSIVLGPGLVVPGIDTAQAADGVIAVDQAGQVRVVVTGANDGAVLRAARQLTTVNRLHGPAVLLRGARPAADPKRTEPWTKDAASFAQLGIGNQEVSGPGTKTFDLRIERPAEWKLIKNGTLRLRIDTAPGVRRGPSYVQAIGNGFDLGTRELEPGKGTHSYDFKVPGGLMDRDLRGRPLRSIDLRLRVHLAAEQQRCTPLDAEAIKATIAPTSSITLKHDDGGRLDLGRFPSSLLTPAPLVVIDRTSGTTVQAAVQMAASIGRWTKTVPKLTNAEGVEVVARRANNLVLLGTADDTLGKPVDIDSRPVGVSPDDVVAFAGLVRSPFDDDRTALVIHGSDAGVLAAARALGTLEGVQSIAGQRVAVVSDAPEAQILRADTGAAPPVELAPVAKDERISNETLIGAVVLGAFLVTLILVIRFRWARPKP